MWQVSLVKLCAKAIEGVYDFSPCNGAYVFFGGDKFLKMEEEFEFTFFYLSNMERITIYDFE